jgi:hypothetical protein
MGRNPQQPEQRRHGLGATVQDGDEVRADPQPPRGGRPHGTDKGRKGGGRGGGVPPGQRSPYPGVSR